MNNFPWVDFAEHLAVTLALALLGGILAHLALVQAALWTRDAAKEAARYSSLEKLIQIEKSSALLASGLTWVAYRIASTKLGERRDETPLPKDGIGLAEQRIRTASRALLITVEYTIRWAAFLACFCFSPRGSY